MGRARRPIFTARRLLVAAALLAALTLGAWFVGRHAVARWVVRRALAAAGLEPASFEVRSVGLDRIRIGNVSVGRTPWLTVGTVDVTYSLPDLLSGRVEAIDVRGARWTAAMSNGAVEPRGSPDAPSRSATPDLPFDRLTLSDSVVRVVMDGDAHEIAINAEVTPAGPGAIKARFEVPGPANWESSGLSGGLRSAAGSVTIRADGPRWSLADGSLAIRGLSLRTGDIALSDAYLDAAVRSTDTVDITSLGAVIGDGSTIEATPFTVNLDAPHVRTRLTVGHISLADWLPLITGNHATGEGRVSGHADIALAWDAGRLRVRELTGSLRADPQHGFIQVADAEAVGDILERQDPRFATDDAMRSVRDKVVAALRDFAFSTLSVDLSRRDDRTIALTRLSGFGRHGEDPQGLNLTLDLQVDDAFLDLASRLAARSKIRNAAAEALDRFFQDGPTPRR